MGPAPSNERVHPIGYLRREEIDIARWDHCVAHASNSLIYGFHYYLDYMAAGQWDALVLGDYEAVMPLTWRSKYGLRYLYQPPFTQQTGIFSRLPVSPDLVGVFLKTASRHFRFAEIFLNYGNAHPVLQARTNYILRLCDPYEQIAAAYTPHLARNLRHAGVAGLQYAAIDDPGMVLDRFRRDYGSRIPHVGAEDYQRLAGLCRYLGDRGQLILRAAVGSPGEPALPAASADQPAWLSSILLLRDQGRLYLLLSNTPPAGRRVRAHHFLVDQVIREWAGQPLVLDLEGSDLPGVARFYADFGAIRQPYFFYRANRLWWPIRFLKPSGIGIGGSPRDAGRRDG